MPHEGTVQDQRQAPNEPTGFYWGYVKVRDPKLIPDKNPEWEEYLLYVDPGLNAINPRENCTFEVEEAELTLSNGGASRKIRVAVLQPYTPPADDSDPFSHPAPDPGVIKR